MSSKQVHRIQGVDPASRQRIAALLTELQQASLRSPTPVGMAVSFVVSSWRSEDDGSFSVQLSPLAAARLPALGGLELLQAAKGLAEASALLPETMA